MTALGTRLLTVSIGGTDYTAQVFNCEIVSRAADSDQTTFAEAAAGGGRIYSLKFVMVQDIASATGLWDKIWTAAGTSIAALIKPYGNAAASASQPHFTGNVTVTEPDGTLVGGDADASTTARWTAEVSWDFTAKPTRIIV